MSTTILNKSNENGMILMMFLSLRGKHSVFHVKYDIIHRLPVGFYKCSLSSLYQVGENCFVLFAESVCCERVLDYQIDIIICFFLYYFDMVDYN